MRACPCCRNMALRRSWDWCVAAADQQETRGGDRELGNFFAGRLAELRVRWRHATPGWRNMNPVNEPLTTAKFGGLYGFWYPHGKDDPAFRPSYTEPVPWSRASSMRALREVNPHAELECRTEEQYSSFTGTQELSELVGFYNLRRWLGWDLLFWRSIGNILFATA